MNLQLLTNASSNLAVIQLFNNFIAKFSTFSDLLDIMFMNFLRRCKKPNEIAGVTRKSISTKYDVNQFKRTLFDSGTNS